MINKLISLMLPIIKFSILFLLLLTFGLPASAENWETINIDTTTQTAALKEFNGYIYAGTSPHGIIYRSINGSVWEMVYNTTQQHILSLESFNGFLYAGTSYYGVIYKSSNGVDWTVAYDSTETHIFSLEEFNGNIYAGTYPHGHIYRSSNGVDWALIEDTTQSFIKCLKSFNGSLYAGTLTNGIIYKSSNGVDWSIAYDSTESHIYCLEEFNGCIYAGTYPHGHIYKSSNGNDWVLAKDSTEAYIESLKSFNNYIYAGTESSGLIYRSSNGNDWVLTKDTPELAITCFEEFNNSIYAGTKSNGNLYKMTPSHISIDHYEYSPLTLFTNYTGILTSSFIVNSTSPLNYSSIAYLMGVNYTITDDYYSYLKVPTNTIADGIYRAHNRNTIPLMWWETNISITENNVWKWSGGTYDDHWIISNPINATHTYINVTGMASNIYPSTFYLGRKALYIAPKTQIEINKAQGIIIKVWDLEQFRGRNNDYYVNLYFDTQLESTPDSNIDIWYCNASFNPDIDDPTTCIYCDRMDTWDYNRWIDHEVWQPDSNVSFSKPLNAYAGIPADPKPDTIDYVYFASNTVTSKSYILNATNVDPNICNLTFAQTDSMWLRNEVSGVNTAYPYTPSFYITFVRDYLEFTHHLYISNDAGEQVHSDYIRVPIGLSNFKPTHSKYNYFYWNTSTDYNMTGVYSENFYVNITLGFDPDDGTPLTHILSLYDNNNILIDIINSSIIGSSIDTDIFVNLTNYCSENGYYYFNLLSTDDEGTSINSDSNIFYIDIIPPPPIIENTNIHVSVFIVMIIIGIIFMIITFICNIKLETALITSMISSITLILTGTLMFTTDVVLYETTHVYETNNSFVAMFLIMLGVIMSLYIIVIIATIVMNHKNKKFDKFYNGHG